MPTFIYHELQDSLLCGQHCLNNLLQEDFFTPVVLGDIAQELDADERLVTDVDIYNYSGESANVDASGNFSIQVLRRALQRYTDIELEVWNSARSSDPLKFEGFIINRKSHWFTIRKIKSNFWDLNSSSDRPQHISQFYLSAFLHQLRVDGCTIFTAQGTLPVRDAIKTSEDAVSLSGGIGKWYTEDELLGSVSKEQQKPKFEAFTGAGHRLDGRGAAPLSAFSSSGMSGSEEGEEYDEELMLARAISASLEPSPVPCSSTSAAGSAESAPAPLDPKAEMRAKRLAALEKRGL